MGSVAAKLLRTPEPRMQDRLALGDNIPGWGCDAELRRPPRLARTIPRDVSADSLQQTVAVGVRPSSALFDIPIDLAEPAELLHTISGWASERKTRRVMYVNAHVVNQSRVTPGLGEALRRADLVYCDGYGVRLAARVLKRPVPHRMTGADWIWSLSRLCERDLEPAPGARAQRSWLWSRASDRTRDRNTGFPSRYRRHIRWGSIASRKIHSSPLSASHRGARGIWPET